MPAPSFSFVLPTFNASGTAFERALESIRAQAYPPDRVEIIVADGGSTDGTRAQAEGNGARVIDNPNRLAEWGVKEGMLVASGDIAVIFAADNELVGHDWLSRVSALFSQHPSLSAVFGRLVSGADDPPLNKYMELVQSEPLNWFLNRNLEWYLDRHPAGPDGFAVFELDRTRPLVWGANGLAVRREYALPAWQRDGYVADVDAFHTMASSHGLVAYTQQPHCYHHQVARLADLRQKWLRNARQHLVHQAPHRDLEWVLVPSFRRRALLWGVYSLVPAFSGVDALVRAGRDRTVYWLYHPVTSFLQTVTYAQALASSPDGRALVRRALGRPPA